MVWENAFNFLNKKLKMKTLIFVSLLAFSGMLCAQSNEQEREMQTLFGNRQLSFGGFGGPGVSYSKFNGKDAWLVGGMGAAVVNHSFFFGGGGFGIVNSPYFPMFNSGQGAYTEGGYGGAMLGVIIKPHKVLHLSIPVLIGGGSLIYSDIPMSDYNHNPSVHVIDQTEFFVVEPGVELELNVFRFMRVAAGVKYRYTSALKLIDTPRDAFNTLSGSITFKFGNF